MFLALFQAFTHSSLTVQSSNSVLHITNMLAKAWEQGLRLALASMCGVCGVRGVCVCVWGGGIC